MDASLEEEVDQVKVMPSMVVPIIPVLHTKDNSSRQRIGTRVLASGIPGSVIGSQGLASKDVMLKNTTSKVLVVLERHDGW